MLNIREIMKLLPHRYPLLLVDRVLEMEPGKRIIGLKNVSVNEQFFQGHFPGAPVMPGVLIIESMAQCGALMFLSQLDDRDRKLFYFGAVNRARFRKPVPIILGIFVATLFNRVSWRGGGKAGSAASPTKVEIETE